MHLRRYEHAGKVGDVAMLRCLLRVRYPVEPRVLEDWHSGEQPEWRLAGQVERAVSVGAPHVAQGAGAEGEVRVDGWCVLAACGRTCGDCNVLDQSGTKACRAVLLCTAVCSSRTAVSC